MFNPYTELDLARDATADEIKKAYRRRAKHTHPDHGGSVDAFQKTRHALVILSDPLKRKKFDASGTIEDEEPDNRRAIALQIIEAFLAVVVAEFLERGINDPRQRDLLKECKAKFKQEIIEANKSIAQGEKVKLYVEDIGKRFSGKDKAKPIERMFENRLRSIDAQIATLKDVIEVRELAIAIIKDYDYRRDEFTQTTTFVSGVMWGLP